MLSLYVDEVLGANGRGGFARRPMLTADEMAVFVEAFERGGLVSPCHWYRNFTRNWERTSGVPQALQPTLMIYGE